MTLNVQFMTMIVMIISGFYLGIIQETFRRFKPHWKDNKFFVYFMEVAFWLSQVLLVFYVLFLVNAGELRFYVFLALFLGFSIYQALAAPLYKWLLEHLIRIIVTCYRFMERLIQILIITPIKYMIKLFVTLVLLIVQFITTLILFVAKVIFFPIRWIFTIIYRLLPRNIQNFFHKLAGFYSTIKNISKKGMKYLKFKRR
ncbi:spore cortex biosynthesis protein YabQ [Virgibacillus sp. FSP13]